MIATISPSSIKGTVNAPASKSAMQRACALALLHKGETTILNPGASNDDKTAIEIVAELGADVFVYRDHITVKSSGSIRPAKIIHCGESGLSLRMFAAIAALYPGQVTMNGSGSLLNRPMYFIDEIFPLLNVKTTSKNGFLPITVSGPLIPRDIVIDGSLSSQYLTGLLFAFAATVVKPVTITVTGLKSKPYIDLSLQMLRYFGHDVIHEGYELFHINPIKPIEKDITYNVEGDWSSAAFILVAGAIAGDVIMTGLDMHSMQADRRIIEVLKDCNAAIHVTENSVYVSNKNPLQNFEFDATDCPDLFPPLVALAAYCDGTSVIKGISRLVAKESNRAETLLDIFTKMGIGIDTRNDAMIIAGGTGVQGSIVSSHNDHRIAMACAVAGLRAASDTIIHDAEAVNKSYPLFYDHFRMLEATIALS